MAKKNCTTVDHLTMLGLRCLTSSNAKFLELTETVTAALEEVDNTKQDKLTFDTTPISGSTKPVTSGGVYTALSGKAAATHTHAASDITSGTLPVARGGTGNTSVDTTPTSGSTKMVTSGGIYTALSGKAAATHTHAASDITSGTLPVARGGTGNTSVDTTPTSGSTKMVTSGGVYTALSGKAATSHASTATTYGIGNGSKYGHVKLSDSTSSTSAASAGIAASPAAVKAAYDLANEAKTLAQSSSSVTALTTAQIRAICT